MIIIRVESVNGGYGVCIERKTEIDNHHVIILHVLIEALNLTFMSHIPLSAVTGARHTKRGHHK